MMQVERIEDSAYLPLIVHLYENTIYEETVLTKDEVFLFQLSVYVNTAWQCLELVFAKGHDIFLNHVGSLH